MGDRIESSEGARRHRVESGVSARYGHSPLLVSVDWVCLWVQ